VAGLKNPGAGAGWKEMSRRLTEARPDGRELAPRRLEGRRDAKKMADRRATWDRQTERTDAIHSF
jgi:hypothetical protein